MLILKLGGAAITDKAISNTPHLDHIRRIAEVLAQHPQPMILIHGAGSYGHITAQEYTLHLGYQEEKQLRALVQLQTQLHDLNRIVVENLVAAGLPAMTVHPASMCILKATRIDQLFIDPIRHMLDLGLLPVLYGDCVWDTEQTFGIISGDQLAVYLANAFGAEQVAFGTNVDGVLDADGQVISEFNLTMAISRHASGHMDVTGGMQGKLQEIAALQNPNTKTHIFNLQHIENLARLLAGDESVGTRLVR
jgi:isopentenyl phosphate kinase